MSEDTCQRDCNHNQPPAPNKTDLGNHALESLFVADGETGAFYLK